MEHIAKTVIWQTNALNIKLYLDMRDFGLLFSCIRSNYYIIIGVALLLLSCGNSRKNDVPIDGGHGIGIDTATVNEIKHYEDSVRTKESSNESTTSFAPSASSSREEYHKPDNMRGFDPASEDDMDDNGMTRFMEVNDEEGWD